METFYEDIGGPAAALALNKNTTSVAVAGRSVFKIYDVGEKCFELLSNMRIVKNSAASCIDIAWNQVDENILASATPSGAIVTWNLSKPGLSKMDVTFQDNRRTVNKINFHCTDPWLLISGSQDCVKVFDLRLNEAVINYSGLSESVRDLQFSPHRTNSFIAVQDNGYIQLYDIRKREKSEQCFPGHNGPILACDWHPELPELVATAGRDMNIKVWNLSSHSPTMQHCIPTMESVSKVRWSYENKNHIASCSLKRDYSINIWDIYRPYIACARFTETHEITTSMAWRRGIHSLISVTSSGVLHHLPISNAYRPLEHANPVGMAINPDGDIALALGNGLLRKSSSSCYQTSLQDNNATQPAAGSNISPVTNQNQSSAPTTLVNSPQQSSLPSKFPYQGLNSRGRLSVTRRSQDSALRPKISSRSQLDVYKCTEMNWFVKTAQKYQLSNRPLAELCDHNAEVCAKLKRYQICQTWKILKLFYANITTNNPTSSQLSTQMSSQHASQQVGTGVPSQPSGSKTLVANIGDDASINSQSGQMGSDFSYQPKNQAPSRNSALLPKTMTMISALNESIPDDASIAGSEHSNDSTDDWLSHENLSYEAFQPKHDFCGRVDKLMTHKHLDDSHSSSGSSQHEDDYNITQTTSNTTNLNSGLMLRASSANDHISNNSNTDNNDLKISHLLNTKAYQYKFYEIIADVIADVLKYHVDNSDVQSAVSILIVLGDRIKNIVNDRIPEMDRESWYYSYIDLLSKFQLWNVMAKVINLSPLPNINSINQTSTTIYTTCGTCNRPLNGKVGWICDRCKTRPSECSICHGVVSGLMAWCQGCYHGGHLTHMSKWFEENEYCPTGCGHMCELSQWR